MSFESLLIDPVTISTPAASTTKDAYNNPEPGSPDVVETVGRIEQINTSENIDGRDVVITRPLLFLKASETIAATSTVTDAAGRVYAVDGDPNEVRGRNGVHHLEVPLKRISAD